MAKLEVTTGVDEQEQESSFQNACLSGVASMDVCMSGVKSLAVSIAVYPPACGTITQQDLKAKFEKDFAHLTELGYDVIIAIGDDNDSIDD